MKIETLKIRSNVYSAIDTYLRSNEFYEVSPPILTPFSCEVACVGGSDLISVDYYGNIVYLSQSGQLYLESLAMKLGRVYCISPTFRAEATSLATHLDEFWMCEVELMDVSLDELIDIANSMVVSVIKTVIEENGVDLETLGVNTTLLGRIIKTPLPRITYLEAIRILRENGILIELGESINSDHERVLGKYCGGSPFFITHFPQELSSFYKKSDHFNQGVTLAFDLIAPDGYGELIGGSIRENDIEIMKSNLQKSMNGIESFAWYLDLIESNPIIHGGFGLGVERLLTWLCNLDSIQEAIPFPRTEGKLWIY